VVQNNGNNPPSVPTVVVNAPGIYDGPYIDHFGDRFGSFFGAPIGGPGSDRTDTPQFFPNNPFSGPTPTLSNTTYYFGVNLTEILGVGLTGQVGIYANASGVGLYFAPGTGSGVDPAPAIPSAVVGYVGGPTSVFKGQFTNFNYAVGRVGGSVLQNTSGNIIGYQASCGPSLTPVSISRTSTYTYTTPQINVIWDPVLSYGGD